MALTQDTPLGRTVAVNVLPEHTAIDPFSFNHGGAAVDVSPPPPGTRRRPAKDPGAGRADGTGESLVGVHPDSGRPAGGGPSRGAHDDCPHCEGARPTTRPRHTTGRREGSDAMPGPHCPPFPNQSGNPHQEEIRDQAIEQDPRRAEQPPHEAPGDRHGGG